MLDLLMFSDECGGLLQIVKFIRNGLFPIIQIGIPIILIIMGSLDLGQAVISNDDKIVKASTGRLVKRVIAAVAIFFVVTLVTVVMGMFGNTDIENTNSWSGCWEAAGN